MFSALLSLAGILLGYAKTRDDKAMVLAVENLRADIAQNQIKADIIKAQLGHRVASSSSPRRSTSSAGSSMQSSISPARCKSFRHRLRRCSVLSTAACFWALS
jgi:hypothetical protein